ncbi:DUF397 domain-containing protein [Nonomuraea sp. NPDC049141]|uniref:DUF397 domain-containing protein n=1 Tax=Nonomuraea sp. NPDC049141 TaxID=3155500 RepID=UPI0034022F5F
MTDEQGWVSSSRSGSGQQCIQMKQNGAGATLRDSKSPSGPLLWASADAWQSFLTGAKTATSSCLLPHPRLRAVRRSRHPRTSI